MTEQVVLLLSIIRDGDVMKQRDAYGSVWSLVEYLYYLFLQRK